MKNLFLILFFSIINTCCNNPNKKTNVTKILQPVEIDNYKHKLVIKTDHNDSIYHFKLQGYDLGDSRYVSQIDEKNENIKSLYLKYKLNDFNADKTFRSINKDTLYTYPLSEQFPKRLFNENYSKKDLNTFYLTAYFDEDHGQVVVIDSIRKR